MSVEEGVIFVWFEFICIFIGYLFIIGIIVFLLECLCNINYYEGKKILFVFFLI